MHRKAAIAAVFSFGLLAVGACTPVAKYQGFQALAALPGDVKPGTDTRASVLSRLGTPTSRSVVDNDTWFYLSQISSKTGFYQPRVNNRNIVAIAFEKGGEQVATVNTYTLKDGRVIAYNGRETPTRGRELSVLEQLLGSISAAGALPPNRDETPNSHGGGR
jgi:outer membrane protein assembly factor BamE (lipoprotein component of BamABCDE complex)